MEDPTRVGGSGGPLPPPKPHQPPTPPQRPTMTQAQYDAAKAHFKSIGISDQVINTLMEHIQIKG